MMDPKTMKVVKLKSILKSKGASTVGNKDVLVKRVSEIFESEQAKAERNESNKEVQNEVTTPSESMVQTPTKQDLPMEQISTEMTEAAPADSEVSTNGIEAGGGLKRKNTGDGQLPQKKKVKGPPLPKTPAVILNEMQPGAQYNLVSENKQAPWFVMEVEFRGEKYLGSGSNKKDAKQNAAANALGSVVQYPDPHRVLPFVTNFDLSSMDFTSDNMDSCASMVSFAGYVQDHFTPRARPPPVSKPVKNPAAAAGKNPVQMLNEMSPGLVYECTADTPVFTMEVTINDHKYEGYGKSKKTAKVGAAIKALRNEYNIVMASPEQESIPSNLNTEDAAPIQISGNLPDLIFSLIRDKFNELIGTTTRDVQNYKVLAGIVMTRGADNEGEVISLATGTKCVSGEYISDQGSALFDCHAEIVSRRGLRRFLYNQLLAVSNGEHTILEPYIDGGYKLRDGIDFHLYINTAPCGDARLFAPHESAAAADDRHPNRRSRGQLRTKIENGEGTIPVDSAALVQERGRGNVQQTWDAVISGERLLTMSCSDKVAKWNVLGLQGSLLSLYIQPIYLSTIILGSLYHCQHLQRGVFTRAKQAVDAAIAVQGGPGLTHPFRVHRPGLAAVPNQRKREAKKAPTYCVHWSQGEESVTVINTATGRDCEGGSSNLCKAEMMKMLKQVISRGGLRPRKVLPNTHQMTYAQLKALANDYQDAKYLLMTGFHKVEYGAWVGKPDEVDQFVCSDDPPQ